MKAAHIPTNKPMLVKSGEEGAALLIAVLILGFIMVLSFGASRWASSAMRGQEQKGTSQEEYWTARSAASNVQAFLLSDIPAQYDRDLAAARVFSNGRPFPAFDAATVSENRSSPVARINPTSGAIERAASDLNQATSLLGQINGWARTRALLAESYANDRGYSPEVVNVADFYEINRRTFQTGEPAYVLRYIVDGRAGRNRVRPSGDVMLGPAMLACNTSIELRAEPPSITRGSSTTLTVLYSNASRIVVTRSTGEILLDQSVSNQSGIQTLTINDSPAASLTYQAQALGNASCSAITPQIGVTVTDPPCPVINTFTANPSNALPGEPVTLTWNVSDATDVRLDGVPVAASGSMIVTAGATNTYTLTAAGPGNWCPQTAQVTVTITPCPQILTFVANPSTVTAGDSSILTWNVSNATGATITLNGAPVGASGSLEVAPSETTSYTLRVTGPGGCPPQEATVTVQVNPPICPTISSFTVSPGRVNEGESVTLSWSVQNAGGASIRLRGPGIDQFVGSSGSLSVAMPTQGTYTFTLDVQPSGVGCGAISASVTVVVDPPVAVSCPSILNFTAVPSCVEPGGDVLLSWDTRDATTVTINGAGSYPATGTLTVNPNVTTTYQLDASAAGCSTATRQVTVNVSVQPTINSFTASPSSIDAGQQSILTWNISGAASATINGAAVNPASGSLTVSPAATTNYVLEAIGGCNSSVVRRTITVTVNPPACDPPTIQSFTATPSSVVQGSGGTVRLAWSITDSSGTGLSVSISPGVGGGLPASGFIDIPAPAATTTYTLTAMNGCGSQSVLSITVTVTPCPQPTIQSFTANPLSVVQGSGGFVRLSWDITDSSGTGLSVSISPGVGGGLPASGFVDISAPAATTTYTLTVINGCGAQSTLTVTVTVTPCPRPTIQSFTGNPLTVITGQSTTLSWNVTDLDSGAIVTLSGPGLNRVVPPSDSQVITPPAAVGTYTYRLSVTNGCDPAFVVERLVVIQVTACPAPEITSFTASPSSVPQGSGATVRLAWTTNDPSGSAVSISISPGVGAGLPPSGFIDIAAPATTTTYTLTATNSCGASSTAQITVSVRETPCPLPPPGQPDASGGSGGGGQFASGPTIQTDVRIIYFANHYPDGVMRFNLRLEVSNRSDGTGLSGHGIIGVVSRPQYTGFVGNLRYNFYGGSYQGQGVGFLGIEFYDTNDNLVATIPFNEIVNQGNYNIYTLSGNQSSFFSDPGAVLPYNNFDLLNDRIGINGFTINAGNISSSGGSGTFNTSVNGGTEPFRCTN